MGVFIIDGRAEVSVGEGVTIAVDRAGLIGEVSFMNGGAASASCFTTPGCRYIVWGRDELHKTLNAAPGIKKGIELKIGRELTRKLSCTTEQLLKDHESSVVLSGHKCTKCGNLMATDS